MADSKELLIDVMVELEHLKLRVESSLGWLRAKLVELHERDVPPLQRAYRRQHSPTAQYRKLTLSPEEEHLLSEIRDPQHSSTSEGENNGG